MSTTNYSATIRVTDLDTGTVETFGTNPEPAGTMGPEARNIVRPDVAPGS